MNLRMSIENNLKRDEPKPYCREFFIMPSIRIQKWDYSEGHLDEWNIVFEWLNIKVTF